jgi:hypothetical protein
MLKPGDIIDFLGQSHVVAEIEEYAGPFDFVNSVAEASDWWGISLESGAFLVVSRVDSLVSPAA